MADQDNILDTIQAMQKDHHSDQDIWDGLQKHPVWGAKIKGALSEHDPVSVAKTFGLNVGTTDLGTVHPRPTITPEKILPGPSQAEIDDSVKGAIGYSDSYAQPDKTKWVAGDASTNGLMQGMWPTVLANHDTVEAQGLSPAKPIGPLVNMPTVRPQGVPLSAAWNGHSYKSSAGEWSPDGIQIGEPENALYQRNLAKYNGLREAYNNNGTNTGPALEMLGSIPLQVAGGAATTAALKGLPTAARTVMGAAGGTLSPGAESALTTTGNFLAGGAGYNKYGDIVPGENLLRAASQSAAGGINGVEGALQTSNLGSGSAGDQAAQGGVAGMAMGAVAGPVINHLGQAWRGSAIAPDVAELADRAQKLGIPIYRTQIQPEGVGSGLTNTTNYLLGSGNATRKAVQMDALTKTLAKSIGINEADGLGPKTLSAAKAAVGQRFDNAAASIGHAPTDVQILSDLQDARVAAGNNIAGPGMNLVEKRLDYIEDLLNGGGMTGQQYKNLTQKGGFLDQLVKNSNGEVSQAGQDIKAKLQDFISRQGSASGSAELQAANQQYKNMKILEMVSAKSNGQLSPGQLGTLADKMHGRYPGYKYGDSSDIGDALVAGRDFIKPDTPGQLGWKNGLKHIAPYTLNIGGMGTALATGHPVMAAGAAGGALGGAVLNRVLNRPGATSAIIDRTLNPPGQSLGGNLLTRMLTEQLNR